jgi:hypothetical protein
VGLSSENFLSSESSSNEDQQSDDSNDERSDIRASKEVWTGLPREEKLLELVEKVALKEYASGLLPFYTIDFFKFKAKQKFE